jgi:hypothetical protein
LVVDRDKSKVQALVFRGRNGQWCVNGSSDTAALAEVIFLGFRHEHYLGFEYWDDETVLDFYFDPSSLGYLANDALFFTVQDAYSVSYVHVNAFL